MGSHLVKHPTSIPNVQKLMQISKENLSMAKALQSSLTDLSPSTSVTLSREDYVPAEEEDEFMAVALTRHFNYLLRGMW